MRISDWSSDVCSSDLSTQADCRTCIVRFLVPLARSEHQFHGSRSERGRIQRWRFPLYLWGDEDGGSPARKGGWRSEEHTSELQSLMRISYAVFCLKKKMHHNKNNNTNHTHHTMQHTHTHINPYQLKVHTYNKYKPHQS